MEKINPEKVIEMLRKQGIEVTITEATHILQFLRKIAEIAVSNYLKKDSK